MAYNKDTWTFPGSIEIEYKYMGNYGAKGEKRQKWQKPTKEQIRKQNQWIREKRMRRLIKANFHETDLWVTLKYPKRTRKPLEEVKKDIKRFLNTESPKFYGINKAKAVVATKEIDKIDATTLRALILSNGGDDDVEGAAVLLLTKEDLQAFGTIRGINEKKAVYEIIPDESNPNTGIIKDGGLFCRYSMNSSLTSLSEAADNADVMYYGKPLSYEVDIFSDYEITVSEDAALKSRVIAVLGEVMVGGNVKVYNGFIKIQKKAAG